MDEQMVRLKVGPKVEWKVSYLEPMSDLQSELPMVALMVFRMVHMTADS